ncbi:hypothetical protein [Actinoplanes utahensis]|nr:hypothetical protein [Actinoplanes utahensis]GIF27478.1 hypothetical protein Aut01nite_04640 [Actinoplanes utahensis]
MSTSGPATTVTVSLWFLGLLGIVSAGLAIGAAVDGDPAAALGFGAAAVFFGHLVGFGVHLWWRRYRWEPSAADGGVTFHYSGWAYYWVVSVAGLMILALLTVGAAFLLAGDPPASVLVPLVTAGLAALFGLAVLRQVYGGRGWLRLTPAGLEHHGPGYLHRLSWDAVAEVSTTTVENGSPLIVLRPTAAAPVEITYALPRPIGRHHVRLLPSMTVRGMWLADDPSIVYRTLRHYHTHPTHRPELTAGTALDRIRERRL